MLRVGDPAPDVVLEATGGRQVRLSDFVGTRHVLLAFYRLDWTPT
jgi:peroxiredoxin